MESNEIEIITTILHDGIGINTENVVSLSDLDKGSGLKNIKKRLELIFATIEYNTNVNSKSSVTIKVPM